MPEHRMVDLRRNSVACSCGQWALRLDKGVRLHSGTRANHLIDSFLRHAAEETQKAAAAPKSTGE